jgi:precorrin-6Y C5,15-methyltransferase (decarboxylating)
LACQKLIAGGRIVVNLATLENLQAACRELEVNGFDAEITLINIARSKAVLELTRLEALNPVFVVAGWRKNEGVPKSE